MNLILDTNIILNINRAKDFPGVVSFVNPKNSILYVSVVVAAEAKSFAIRNNWGIKRLNALDKFLDQAHILEVEQAHIKAYTEIDNYSQRTNPNFQNYPFDTPRNMGKNDLWIASAAAFLNLTLISTDSDFDHLHNVFFEHRKIKPEEFIKFF
jgi:tRNA(fMet)-specific endonuclease VapC